MNKKKVMFVLMCILGFASAQARANEWIDTFNCAEKEKSVKLRAAAFYPSEDRVRSIYGRSWASYQVESTVKVHPFSFLWVNADWMNKHGQTENLKSFTSLRMLSFSFGCSLLGEVREDLKIYLGCGYSLSHLKVHNRYTFQHRNQQKFVSGFQAKSGILYAINCNLFTEFFIDYLCLSRQFKSKVSLSGFKIGGGLGYNF